MLEALKSNHLTEMSGKGILYKTIAKTRYLIKNHMEICKVKQGLKIYFKILSCYLCFGDIFLYYLNFSFSHWAHTIYN